MLLELERLSSVLDSDSVLNMLTAILPHVFDLDILYDEFNDIFSHLTLPGTAYRAGLRAQSKFYHGACSYTPAYKYSETRVGQKKQENVMHKRGGSSREVLLWAPNIEFQKDLL